MIGPPHQFFGGEAQGRELVRGFASLKRGICGLEGLGFLRLTGFGI